jgi:hypothetical protein
LPLHKDITDPNLHEPKGVAAASASTVYEANGAGTGNWVKIHTGNINTGSIKNVNKLWLTTSLADVSTASSALVPVNFAGSLVSVRGVLGGAITAADSVLTVRKNGAGSLGTSTVLYTASAKGDGYTTTIAGNTLVSGDYIEIATDGASSTAARMDFILEFSMS